MSWPMTWMGQSAQPPMPSTNFGVPAPPPGVPPPAAAPPLPAGPPPPPPASDTQATAVTATNPYAYNAYQMTAEQQYYMQWQSYQQQYAQWQAMYGEQWNKEMAKTGTAAASAQPKAMVPAPPTKNTTTATNPYVYPTYQQRPPPVQPQVAAGPQVYPTSYNYDLVSTESNAAYPNNWEGDSNDAKKKKKKKKKRVHMDDSMESFEDDNDEESSEKSAEEIAFDEQFRKWEEQFDEWKRQNANHPDREAYYEYENKMQEVRKKLLQRRADMRAKRLQASDIAPKTRLKNHPQQQQQQQWPLERPQRQQLLHEQPEQQSTNDPVYPANAFQPIPGLDLLDNDQDSSLKNNKRRKKPKKKFDADPDDDEQDAKKPRNLPFGFRDFFERLRDDNSNGESANTRDTELVNQSNANDLQQQQRRSRWEQNQWNDGRQAQNQKPSPWKSGQSSWQNNGPKIESQQFPQSQFGGNQKASGGIRPLMEISVSMPINDDDNDNLKEFNNPFDNDNNSPNNNDRSSNQFNDDRFKDNFNESLNNFPVDNANMGRGPANRPFKDNQFNNLPNSSIDNSNDRASSFSVSTPNTGNNRPNNDGRPLNNNSFNESANTFRDKFNTNLSGNRSNIGKNDERPFSDQPNSFIDNFNNNITNFAGNRNMSKSGPMNDGRSFNNNSFNNSSSPFTDKFNDNIAGDKLNMIKNSSMNDGRPFNENPFSNRPNSSHDNSPNFPRRDLNMCSSGPNNNCRPFNSNRFNDPPNRSMDKFNDNFLGKNLIMNSNDQGFRPPLAVYDMKVMVPVKVIDYNHIPRRFQKLHMAKVIDYSHKRMISSPLAQCDSRNQIGFNDDRRNHSQQPRQDTWSSQFKDGRNQSKQPLKGAKDSNNQSIQSEDSLSPVSEDESKEKGKQMQSETNALRGRGSSRWNTANSPQQAELTRNSSPKTDADQEVGAQAKSSVSLFPIATSFVDGKDKEENNAPPTSLPLIRPVHHNVIKIEDILYLPGRATRPNKIVILMRGLPGSGKTHLAKLIKDKETEIGGSGKVRILSIDDYFSTENEADYNEDGEKNEAYKYDATMEETYMTALLKVFRTTITGGMYDIIIVDCNNTTLRYYTEFYNFATIYKFTAYTCEMDLDVEKCLRNNVHNRSLVDIERAYKEWKQTPPHYIHLDCGSLLNPPAEAEPSKTEEISDDEDSGITAAENEDEVGGDNAEEIPDDKAEVDTADDEDVPEADMMNELGFLKSKWDTDTSEEKLARLDGINKPMRHTIEDYLQMDGWEPPPTSSNGKKRVRWADIEERREQDKQRAIGFVVGQTNWDNILGNNDGSEALNKIKYI